MTWPPEPGSHASDVRASVLLSGVSLGDVRMELTQAWLESGRSVEALAATMAMYDVLLIEGYSAASPASDAEALALVLREQGLDTGGASPHSWRCEYPDRYPGACTCVEDTAQAILEAGFHRG